MNKEQKIVANIINQESANKPTGDSLVLPNFSSAAGAELVNGKFNTVRVTGTTTLNGLATTTSDMDTDDTIYIANVLHGQDAVPPAANTVPRGSIYLQYTP
jgi:hypothetical protein